MRKGHRRTQSAYIAASRDQIQNTNHGQINSNQIVKLLQASDKKITSKVINYERLEVNSLQQNNYLKFGNFTMEKASKYPSNIVKMQMQTNQNDLNCIPENNKSSQISSQKLSKQGGCREDDIPTIPTKKIKQKRVSDFRRLEIEKNQKSAQEAFPGKRNRLGKSLKKR